MRSLASKLCSHIWYKKIRKCVTIKVCVLNNIQRSKLSCNNLFSCFAVRVQMFLTNHSLLNYLNLLSQVTPVTNMMCFQSCQQRELVQKSSYWEQTTLNSVNMLFWWRNHFQYTHRSVWFFISVSSVKICIHTNDKY